MSSMMMGGMRGMHRPDPSQMADKLFSKLDTKGQGYIEKSDLASAFDQIASKSSTPSVDDVFSSLDGDGDGKVTQQDMSDGIQKLADQLESQFQSMRMSGGMSGGMGMGGGMMGMGGMSQSDLSGMAESATGGASEILNDLVQNFDAADTNQDGKVSGQEARAYQSSSDTASSATSEPSLSSSDASLMARIMELAASYGAFSQDDQASSTLSTVA